MKYIIETIKNKQKTYIINNDIFSLNKILMKKIIYFDIEINDTNIIINYINNDGRRTND
jgi:hypothetical protein